MILNDIPENEINWMDSFWVIYPYWLVSHSVVATLIETLNKIYCVLRKFHCARDKFGCICRHWFSTSRLGFIEILAALSFESCEHLYSWNFAFIILAYLLCVLCLTGSWYDFRLISKTLAMLNNYYFHRNISIVSCIEAVLKAAFNT